MKGASFFEMGVGSGLISIFAAMQGASVVACDISRKAISDTKANALNNNVQIELFQSDLFVGIPQQIFDIIVVNPPYYKRTPISEADHAMYCGEKLEYFTRFFEQARKYSDKYTKIWMILSDDCDIKGISSIAESNGYNMLVCYQQTKFWEINYIFEISLKEF